VATTLNVAVWPTVTLCELGADVMAGAAAGGSVVELAEVELSDEPPPQAVRRNAVRASELRNRIIDQDSIPGGTGGPQYRGSSDTSVNVADWLQLIRKNSIALLVRIKLEKSRALV
jgi:hypothetical protein